MKLIMTFKFNANKENFIFIKSKPKQCNPSHSNYLYKSVLEVETDFLHNYYSYN